MRARNWLCLVGIILVACSALAGKNPNLSWQSATLIDIRDEQQTSVFTIGSGQNQSLHGGSYTIQHFIIDTPNMTYDVVPWKLKTLAKLRKGDLTLIVNAQIEFAISKMDMYLKGTNGQVGEFHIEKRTLKQQR